MMLNMGRVAIFLEVFCHVYVVDGKFDKGTATLQNEFLTVWRFDHSLYNFMGFIFKQGVPLVKY